MRIEVRAFHQNAIALGYVVHRQSAQAANAEIFAHERADNIAMHHAASKIFDAVLPIGAGIDGGEVAQETTCKSIARAGGIDHFFQWIGGRAKERAIRAKE